MTLLRTNAVASLACFKRTRPQRRCLFSLPDLSSLSPFGNDSKTYQERKVLPYRQQDLYAVVSDIAAYPRFIPYCTSSRILAQTQRADGAVLMDAELTVGFMAFTESYVSKVTCVPHKSVEAVASSETPLFKSLSTLWRFQPATPTDPNKTLVTLDLAYAFTNPLHAAVSSSFFGKVSGMMVQAFEDRCAEVYGRGGRPR
ncbi:hypothetical protein CYLTODRAFT_434109 [Cylindrobasidium torrendii FP15055 ss-10]|uniref:Coenzyme Q-binding protein COQ10 START domain-containing protein n=1 Tax=Cylindrobasidium torrendii FP15055 ss-10 TaxID=1314674 RepID=A0A0D7BVX4_9AGAR|nr:hypothetical protein CYLTODRAFT_434109 [Cylindrobasidium torrendii FP15055 ss-10]